MTPQPDLPAEVAEALEHLAPVGPCCAKAHAAIRAHIASLERQLAEVTARAEGDAKRLDFIAPGFRVLAGNYVLQVWWIETLPDGKKVSRVASVPVNTPDAVRAAIDAASATREGE